MPTFHYLTEPTQTTPVIPLAHYAFLCSQRKKTKHLEHGIVAFAREPGFAVGVRASSVLAVASRPILHAPFVAIDAFKAIASRIAREKEQEKRKNLTLLRWF